MSELFPTGVVVDRETRSLTISWEDGEQSVISWRRLRMACPCAGCRGEFNTLEIDESGIAGSASETELADIKLMGQYALQPVWASDHSTGIFTWEYLRSISDKSTG